MEGTQLGMPEGMPEGAEAGFRRTSGYDLEVPQLEVQYALDATAQVVSRAERMHPRFVSLFTENVTTAAVARFYYGDEPLRHDLLQAYFNYSRPFFNSFTHL